MSTTVKWDHCRDEIYTTFGTCRICGWDSIQEGSRYCAGCGAIIVERKRKPSLLPRGTGGVA